MPELPVGINFTIAWNEPEIPGVFFGLQTKEEAAETQRESDVLEIRDVHEPAVCKHAGQVIGKVWAFGLYPWETVPEKPLVLMATLTFSIEVNEPLLRPVRAEAGGLTLYWEALRH